MHCRHCPWRADTGGSLSSLFRDVHSTILWFSACVSKTIVIITDKKVQAGISSRMCIVQGWNLRELRTGVGILVAGRTGDNFQAFWAIFAMNGCHSCKSVGSTSIYF